MKQNQIILIVVGFILVALMATNPSTEEHKEAVKEKISAAFENNNSEGNAFQKLGEQLGQTIGMVIIDKMIKREREISQAGNLLRTNQISSLQFVERLASSMPRPPAVGVAVEVELDVAAAGAAGAVGAEVI